MSYYYKNGKNRIKTIRVEDGNRTAFYDIEEAIENLKKGYNEDEAFELARTELFTAPPKKIPFPSVQETVCNADFSESTIKFQNMINENFSNIQNAPIPPHP